MGYQKIRRNDIEMGRKQRDLGQEPFIYLFSLHFAAQQK
jgi:hypothetical protein